MKPAFEIHLGARTIKIYADGRVEGLDGVSYIVINRIPMLMGQAIAGALSKAA